MDVESARSGLRKGDHWWRAVLASKGVFIFSTILVCLMVGGVYSSGFKGFWLSDDFSNLHRVFSQHEGGRLWPETWKFFLEPVPSLGAFYRPMMMFSLALNYQLGGADYENWYLVNFAVHVLNTFLLALVVRRLAALCACDAVFSAPLAALMFGLCPFVAEGVYWVSARSDGWVTFFSLSGYFFWLGKKPRDNSLLSYSLPILLALALGFKESAAVVPFQIFLAGALFFELSRHQRISLFLSFLVVILFLVWRIHLFGGAWEVYAQTGSIVPWYEKILPAIFSIGPWWSALGNGTPFFSLAYPSILFGTVTLLFLLSSKRQRRLGGLLFGAGIGVVGATLLNLGALSSSGEGGRLFYGPVAWLCLSVGVLASFNGVDRPDSNFKRLVAILFPCVTLLVGSGVLIWILMTAWEVQGNMRKIANQIPDWAERYGGVTMLVIPDHHRFVVMGRNAQAGVALEPVQRAPYFHQVIPALPSDLDLRALQFCGGMARRLQVLRPRFASSEMFVEITSPAEALWPDSLACWSKKAEKMVLLSIPNRDASCDGWRMEMRRVYEGCDG